MRIDIEKEIKNNLIKIDRIKEKVKTLNIDNPIFVPISNKDVYKDNLSFLEWIDTYHSNATDLRERLLETQYKLYIADIFLNSPNLDIIDILNINTGEIFTYSPYSNIDINAVNLYKDKKYEGMGWILIRNTQLIRSNKLPIDFSDSIG